MLEVSGQPGLCSKFEARQGYRARPCLKKPKLVTQFEVSMSACICGYHMCAWCLNKPEEVSDFAELKLQVVMIHHMGAGN